MTLGSPWWLVGLGPWAAVAVYLLRGARRRAGVPFLGLWKGEVVARPARPAWRVPPAGVVLGLLAALVGILGAAGPEVRGGRRAGEVVLVVDRGLTMSMAGNGGVTRWEALRREVVAELTACGVRWREVVVPDGAPDVTAVDTTELVRQAVREQLNAGEAPVLVLTDRDVGDVLGTRGVWVKPASAPEDVAVTGVAVRMTPWPQVMVSVRNDSAMAKAPLRVWTSAGEETREVELPARGTVGHFFFPVTAGAAWMGAEVMGGDERALNDRAWAAREVGWPRVRAEVADEAVRRVTAVYVNDRPAGSEAGEVVVANTAPVGGGVMVAGDCDRRNAGGDFVVNAHAVTAGVNWHSVRALPDLRLSNEGPPAGWTDVVSVGHEPLVAVAPAGRRAVWIGFKSQAFERTPDFVIFWANVLTWVGGEEQFGSDYVRGGDVKMERIEGSGGWLPGLYRDVAGRLHAVNAPDVKPVGGGGQKWKAKLGKTLRAGQAGTALGPWAMVAAAGLFAAALFAPRT